MKKSKPLIFVTDDPDISADKLSNVIREAQNLRTVLNEHAYSEVIQKVNFKRPEESVIYVNFPKDECLVFVHDIHRMPAGSKVIMITDYTLEPDNKPCLYLGAQYFIDVLNEPGEIEFCISKIHLN